MNDSTPNIPSIPEPEPQGTVAAKTPPARLWLFTAVLLAPALLTLATAHYKDAWPFFTFFGSIIAGLVCGFMLSFRLCKTVPGKLLGGVGLSLVFIIASFIACCFGCSLGGAQLRFN